MTLPRTVVERETSLGMVRVKTVQLEGRARRSPEFEDCRRIARERSLPFPEVVRILERELDGDGEVSS
jgi:hypothetical protein